MHNKTKKFNNNKRVLQMLLNKSLITFFNVIKQLFKLGYKQLFCIVFLHIE